MRRICLLALVFMTPAAMAGSTWSIADHNNALVAAAPGSQGVFTVRTNGDVVHAQSGMICPGGYDNFELVDVRVIPSEPIGSNVVCDYGRHPGGAPEFVTRGAHVVPKGDVNKLDARLMIFLAKAGEGASLDSLFDDYKKDVVAANRDALEMSAELELKDPATRKLRTDYRATGWSILADQPSHTELIVGLFKGWVLVVRADYKNATIHADDNTSPEQLRIQLLDIENPYLAFVAARDGLLAQH
jgi:hypothetical protein